MKKKNQNENYDKKIFISNIITFIVILVAVVMLNKYLQILNYESQYLYYTKHGNIEQEINLNLSELNITGNKTINYCNTNQTEEFDIGYDIIIPVGVSLLLILNTLYYVIQNIYKKFHIRNTSF